MRHGHAFVRASENRIAGRPSRFSGKSFRYLQKTSVTCLKGRVLGYAVANDPLELEVDHRIILWRPAPGPHVPKTVDQKRSVRSLIVKSADVAESCGAVVLAEVVDVIAAVRMYGLGSR
jgi:hypothetical protein